MLLATILTQILSRTTDLLPGVREDKISLRNYMAKIVPISLTGALSLVLGNTAYQFISLSYIQMLKAFTPVPVLFLSFLTGKEEYSVSKVWLVLMVCFGVFLSSIGELRFNLIGFLLQVNASFLHYFTVHSTGARVND
jgi:EamA domain-containing membrane protein RarD